MLNEVKKIIFLFVFDSLRPSQQFFSYVNSPARKKKSLGKSEELTFLTSLLG